MRGGTHRVLHSSSGRGSASGSGTRLPSHVCDQGPIEGEQQTKVSAIGYCIGDTLLAMTLAYMAEIGDKRIESASFLTTQTDFSQAGDLRAE
jgi:hypothetical protein